MPQAKWMTPILPQRCMVPTSIQWSEDHILGWTASSREYSFLTPDPYDSAHTHKAHQVPIKKGFYASP